MEWQTDATVSCGRPQGAPGQWWRGAAKRGSAGDGSCRLPGCVFDRAENAPRLLSELQAREIYDAAKTFLKMYAELMKLSIRRERPRYKIIPKFHVLWHIVSDVWECRLNCRHFHCFLDEDYMGQMKSMTERLPKIGLEYRLLTRWLLRLGASRRP